VKDQNIRLLDRRVVHQIVDVIDTVSERNLGRLVNIHREGLMLLGDAPLKTDALYQVVLRLPEPMNGQSEVSVGVDCLWLRELEEGGQFWAGFQIIDISAQDLEFIDALV